MLNKLLNKFELSWKGQNKQLDLYLEKVMSFEGQISQAEAQKLIELAQSTQPNTVIVEIGTYRGRSAIALAFGSLLGNHNRVYAIDPHIEFQGIFGGKFGIQDQAELYQNIVEAGVGHIVAVISLHSVEAAKSWSARNVGLLWVDGDHHYEAVRQDYEAWCPFLIEGGILAFHDSSTPGVKQLIDELVGEGKILPLEEVESLYCFKWVGR